MKIVLPGGSGHVGRLLVRELTTRGHECVVLSRGARPVPGAVRVVPWDGRTLGEWRNEFEDADVVINLAGRSVDCRYSEANLREMLRSRVDATRVVGEAIARCVQPPRVWLQMATATIYAHRFDAPNDEATGVIGGNEPGAPTLWRRSVEIAQAWEAEVFAATTPSTRKLILRSAMVMSADHGSVFDVLAKLCQAGLGRQGDGRQFVSWIHGTDFVRAIDFLAAREDLSGVFNLASPEPLPNREFMAAIHAALSTRVAIPVPAWALEVGAVFLRTETELILKSRRVVPGRLCAAGFEFEFKRWAQAAGELVKRRDAQGGSVMKPWKRVMWEFFGTPAIGACLMTLWAGWEMASHAPSFSARLSAFFAAMLYLPIYLAFGYLFAGLPALIYTLVMEFLFARGLNPRSGVVVVASTLLGLLSGFAICGTLTGFSEPKPNDNEWWRVMKYFCSVGSLVGLISGAIITGRARSRTKRIRSGT
jgi:uncharacterized protein (TIGR01777 family)